MKIQRSLKNKAFFGNHDKKRRYGRETEYEVLKMTLAEMAEMFQISPNYLANQWSQIVKSKEKQGIYLVKIGRGSDADYGYRTIKNDYFEFEYRKAGGK